MAKIPINRFLLLSSRSYVVAAENARVKVQPVAAGAPRKPAAKEALPSANKEEIFWLRDPKTGNWVPESHLGNDKIDPVELREKLLSRKHSKCLET